MFNTHFAVHRRTSFTNQGARPAAAAIEKFAANATVLAENVSRACFLCPNPVESSRLAQCNFVASLSGPGMPDLGYLQHLGIEIWHCGFGRRHFRIPAVHPGPTVRGGAANGLCRIFPFADRARMHLARHRGAYRGAFLRSLRHAVRKSWAKHGREVEYPAWPGGIVPEMKSLATQLCAWHRADYGKHVRELNSEWWAGDEDDD